MSFYKLFTFLLVCGLIIQTAAAQTTETVVKGDELPAEMKENALKLLAAVAQETEQFNLPANRILMRVVVADLLWRHDRQAAQGLFQNAYGELSNLLAGINLPEPTDLTSGEKSERYMRRSQLAALRRELVLALALRDPQTAFDTLKALQVKPIEGYDPLNDNELDFQLTTVIAKKDPDKSYKVPIYS